MTWTSNNPIVALLKTTRRVEKDTYEQAWIALGSIDAIYENQWNNATVLLRSGREIDTDETVVDLLSRLDNFNRG